MALSTRENVYRFVRERILAGTPPTVREVQSQFGFKSSASARQHLDKLVNDGLILKLKGISRGFRLPEQKDGKPPIHHVPIMGQIQAGQPILAVEDIEGTIPMSGDGLHQDSFALRVRGDSMKDAGILAGDLVIVRPQPDADNGDIVAVLIGDEATVKRLKKRENRVELHPENPDFQPIILKSEGARLLGKIIEVRRHL